MWTKRNAAKNAVPQRLESEARLIEGSRRTFVKLMLEPNAIAYRGNGLRHNIELNAIDRIEYASYLVRGGIPNGTMLRVSCADQTFEFVLDSNGEEWPRRLPARRRG